ncbi:ABC transporter ATP-binding protein [Enterococcus raffinosus]|uniref:ABC transporter ATP-binding protein n=1 Tax=Enterococcus TaxID=1350 RepID=UPI001C483FBD|nr:ABC transporter ATP-binding protein [Enterococcus raffinosus]MDT2572404.1 ABC transporter ATP-binding protein [Enterococcus raffinosus]QXJ59532.1 ABC transporter ATP-binding protein [Enterococcus raffinosus]
MAEQKQNRPHGGGPGRGMAAPVEKAKDFKGTIKKLVSYLGAYKIAVFFVMIFAAASTIFNIWGPKILSKAITELFNGLIKKYQGTGDINFEKIGGILVFMLGLYLVASLFGVIQGWIMSTISQRITYRMRKEISEKINRMPMNYFESRTTGEVLSRITNDVDTLGQSLNQSLTQLITSTFTIVGVIVMMLSISVKMTGIAILIVPISLILILVVVKNSQKYFKTQQEYLGVINGKVEETIGGYTIVRLFNEEENSLKEFKEQNDVLFKSAWKSQFLSGLMQPIMNFVGNLGYVGVAIAGGVMAYNGSITVGDIQAFIQYVRNLTQPIAQLAQVSNMLQSMAAAAERVFEFLAEDEEDQLAENPVQIDKAEGMVDFEHVQFGYTPDKIVIQDFTSHVDPGQTVAIVGPTGAGKTTMVKLLMRFYDVNSGAIKIDGHNIKDFNRADLRKNIGMVLQDTWLFKGTIMDNLRYGRLDATDEEVYAAAKAAHVDHFIKTLPGGYNMELNEESSNISQGQKQLLTIARAILADKPILILDEATSSVDTRTEGLIQEAMNNLMKGRTSFVIAHRLSTIKDADKILYMQGGDIKEQGSHEELLAQNGLYAALYNSQFEELSE